MQQQQQMYDQDGYGFSAQPQAIQQQQQLYRPDEDVMQDSDDGFNQQEYHWQPLEDEEEDETQLVPDYYIDRPATPEFKPLPKGIDVETQIVDTELFDFEIEVVPVLQVLVGKTIDQARMELIESSEQEELKKHKDSYIMKRNAELLVTQRMENAFLRKKEERERRDQQHRLRKEQDIIAHKKLVSRNLAKRCLTQLKNNSLNDLEDNGFLEANTTQNIKKRFMPWLFKQIVEIHKETTLQNEGIRDAVSEFRNNTKDGHQQSIQNEIERKKEVLRQREIRRLLLEERKKKKKEWKRKQALKEAREALKEKIEINVAMQAQKLEHIGDGNFTDILGDQSQTPVVGLFGGVIGQLWYVLGSLPKAETEEQEDLLSEENIYEFVMDLLLNKLKNPLTIHINSEFEQLFQDNIKLMEDNLAVFNEKKEEFINQIIDNPDVYTNFSTLNHIKNSNQIPIPVLKSLLKSLLNIFFKSVIYKDPVPPAEGEQKPEGEAPPTEGGAEGGEKAPEGQQQEAEKPSQEQQQQQQQEQQQPQEPQQPIERPEPTEEELKMVEAKKKIQIQFNSLSQYEPVEAILRIRIPFLSEEEIQKEKEEEEERLKLEQSQGSGKDKDQKEPDQPKEGEESKQEQPQEEKKESEIQPQEEEKEEKELTEEEKEALKYAVYDEYVEIYNGEKYFEQLAKKLEVSRRKDISQEQAVSFQIQGHKIGIQDERSELYFRQWILQLLKEQYAEKFENIDQTLILEKCDKLDSEIQKGFVEQQPRAEDIAIIEHDFYQ